MFGVSLGYGQKKYAHSYTAQTQNFDGLMLEGYTTSFDFGREEIRRAWWKYAKKFGQPLNMKSYYMVQIPSALNDGNQDIIVYTQAKETDGKTAFFLGFEKKEFKDEALNLIVGFKKEFYIRYFLEQIDAEEKQRVALSAQYLKKADSGGNLLNQLHGHQQTISELKDKILNIEIR